MREALVMASQPTSRYPPGEESVLGSGLCIWAFSGRLWEEADKGWSRVHALSYDTSGGSYIYMSVLLFGGQDGPRHIQILSLAIDS